MLNQMRDLWGVVAAHPGKPGRQTAAASRRTPHEARRPAIAVNEQHRAEYARRVRHVVPVATGSSLAAGTAVRPFVRGGWLTSRRVCAPGTTCRALTTARPQNKSGAIVLSIAPLYFLPGFSIQSLEWVPRIYYRNFLRETAPNLNPGADPASFIYRSRNG